MIWFGRGRDMFRNVLEYFRMFWETPKSFMVVVGGSIFAITKSTQVLDYSYRKKFQGCTKRHLPRKMMVLKMLSSSIKSGNSVHFSFSLQITERESTSSFLTIRPSL